MGRPLKIAEAQAILTLTATTGATDVVTVSQTLSTYGVIAGMPFTVATTTGGLTAGTTYWVLTVTGALTFTVSATPLNANPTYAKVDLSDAGPVTVSLTVGAVDTGFNNPSGSANTYSVVGGNTGIYGKQVLCRVAIGENGTGTIYASTSSNVASGVGTDFGNIAVGSIIQSVNATTGAATTLGFVDTATGDVTVAVANTQATGNFIGTSGNAQTLVVNQPLTVSANLGGLVTGTTYFVKAIANAAALTVSTTVGGAAVTLTNATGTPNLVQNQVLLTDVAEANAAGTSFIQAINEAGFIVRQKGKTKYLVQGGTTGLVGACYTANIANASLTPNTMNIVGTYANSSTAFLQSISDHTGEIFGSANALPNASPMFGTFNTAYAANTYGGQPYPIVTVSNT